MALTVGMCLGVYEIAALSASSAPRRRGPADVFADPHIQVALNWSEELKATVPTK